jgi:hypothetical protein
MAGKLVRLALAAAIGLDLAGCASDPGDFVSSNQTARVGAIQKPDSPLQCVPYARQQSGVRIFGDAYTWWDKAAGKFVRGTAPRLGAVMVLTGYAGPNHSHLAVVRNLVSPREIKVDHANWLNDGQIYVDDPVVDVSEANDWSKVRIWNIRASAWGTRIYPVQGFIGPGPDTGSDAIASLIGANAAEGAIATN